MVHQQSRGFDLASGVHALTWTRRTTAARRGVAGSAPESPESDARRNRVPVDVWNPRPVAPSWRRTLHARRRRPRTSRAIRAGRVVFGPVWRQFKLARTDLVSGKLPARGVPAEVPSLSRRRFPRRVPDRIGPDDDARRGGD